MYFIFMSVLSMNFRERFSLLFSYSVISFLLFFATYSLSFYHFSLFIHFSGFCFVYIILHSCIILGSYVHSRRENRSICEG